MFAMRRGVGLFAVELLTVTYDGLTWTDRQRITTVFPKNNRLPPYINLPPK
jgi:hypothetical protein